MSSDHPPMPGSNDPLSQLDSWHDQDPPAPRVRSAWDPAKEDRYMYADPVIGVLSALGVVRAHFKRPITALVVNPAMLESLAMSEGELVAALAPEGVSVVVDTRVLPEALHFDYGEVGKLARVGFQLARPSYADHVRLIMNELTPAEVLNSADAPPLGSPLRPTSLGENPK